MDAALASDQVSPDDAGLNPLTSDVAGAISVRLDQAYADILRVAQANVDDFKTRLGPRALLSIFSGGAEYARELELERQLESVKAQRGQLDQLEAMIPAALADADMGGRWIAAAKHFEQNFLAAKSDLSGQTIDDILAAARGTISSVAAGAAGAVSSVVPWWVWLAGATLVAFELGIVGRR